MEEEEEMERECVVVCGETMVDGMLSEGWRRGCARARARPCGGLEFAVRKMQRVFPKKTTNNLQINVDLRVGENGISQKCRKWKVLSHSFCSLDPGWETRRDWGGPQFWIVRFFSCGFSVGGFGGDCSD